MTLGHIFYAITTALTLTLAVLTLQRLLSGWWRQYYLLVVLLVLMLAGVVPAISSFVNYGDWTSTSAQRMYWMFALAYQITTFSFLLQLIYEAGQKLPTQGTLVRTLTVCAILAATISVFLHFDKRLNTFMTLVSRDLTFLSALLNLVLWKFLLQIRKRGPLLLAVSAGLGIQCTGDAIGHSIRMLSRSIGSADTVQEMGNVVMSLASVLTVGIWHIAFARAKYTAASAVPSAPGTDGSSPETPSKTSPLH